MNKKILQRLIPSQIPDRFSKLLCSMAVPYSREASDAGEFHLKTKSRDFRVIFDEKWRSTLRLKYVGLQ
jgi:hypothetical protein